VQQIYSASAYSLHPCGARPLECTFDKQQLAHDCLYLHSIKRVRESGTHELGALVVHQNYLIDEGVQEVGGHLTTQVDGQLIDSALCALKQD